MKILRYLIITLFIISWITQSFATIDFTVSPIKYEIDTHTWASITKSAILFNNSNQSYTITTWKSDFEATNNTWNPKFVRKSELVYSDQELASWITVSTWSFDIAANSKKEIIFTINVPNNATPGWHYWAVFFKRSTSSSWAEVWINVDYWVLVLVNVEWEIIESWELEDTIISTNGWWGWYYIPPKKDDCPLWDLTKSAYDWKCIDDLWIYWPISENADKIEDLPTSDLEEWDFAINFDTLFINDWNTHLKPTWKIVLTDEDWNEIKWIWKKIVKNDNWAIIWEEIVDYIPINDNEWNVLPNTKRKFEAEWKWFPYEWYNENWKKIIKYWSPEEYYTRQNIEERRFLMPWERVNERINHEKINAKIELWYTNRDWENIEFNSAKEFYVDYKEKYIWLNPYFFIIVFIILLLFFLIWLIFRKKKKKCSECGKKINKDMKLCPYCGKKQKYINKKKKS
jgi:hypothetical protein